MEYLWNSEINLPQFSSLQENIKTDVLIIGGGIAGLLCAKRLQEAKVDYVLVEGNKVGLGITKGTTAVITAQHDVLYQDLIKRIGKEKTELVLKAHLWAVEEYRRVCKKIDCDFEEKPSIMYTLEDKDLLIKELEALKSLGYEAETKEDINLPFDVEYSIKYPHMAQFHPLKFIASIAKDLKIYEQTFIKKIKKNTAFTQNNEIAFNKVIIATHFPFMNRHGMYFMKMYQKRSFVIALENAPQLNSTIIEAKEGGIYLRNYKNLLLVGGSDHRTGKKEAGFSNVRAFIDRYYPQFKEKYVWANQDCMTLDEVAYIGHYSKTLKNTLVATGFNEWGMTTSMIASYILADIILDKENEFAEAFNPSRSVMHPQLFKNLGSTLINFVTPTKNRCTHLGCPLKWNEDEGTYDCPCHGSRFTTSGEVINNPAMKNKKKKLL